MHRGAYSLVYVCVAVASSACGSTPAATDGGADAGDPGRLDFGSERCSSDPDCDNGVFCDGAERCSPSDSLANTHGCVASPAPCPSGETCDEALERCIGAACAGAAGDADGDGHTNTACGGDDCDDADANAYPGNRDVCDGADHDEDCDPTTYGYRDDDSDGYASAACCNVDGASVERCGLDCNDASAASHPGLPEVCDTLDNDCNGVVDEGVTMVLYPDADRDGFGAVGSTSITGCLFAAGLSTVATDCQDTIATVHPGAPEVCDLRDNDCNGSIDDGALPQSWYLDADGDGYGDADDVAPVTSCAIVPGRATNDRDCSDAVATVHPGAPETCDALDNDCNGTVDDRLGTLMFWTDADGDGYGDPASTPVASCAPTVAGRTPNNVDCNDANRLIYPFAPERCDSTHVDDDCNPSTNPFDSDSDGHDRNTCGGSDCDDADSAVYPGVTCVVSHATSLCLPSGACATPVCVYPWESCRGGVCNVQLHTDTDCQNCGHNCTPYGQRCLNGSGGIDCY